MLRHWQISARQVTRCFSAFEYRAGGAAPAAGRGASEAALVLPADTAERASSWLPWLLSASAAAALQLLHPAQVQADQGTAPESTPGWSLLDLDTRRRAFFKYEKRIRDFSPPDKVFEYFATTEVKGVRMMRPENLLCSMVAVFPPEGSITVRSGSLPGEPSAPPDHVKAAAKDSLFTRLFDMDNDGAISYFEYLLLVTFLSIPPADVAIAFQMFDVDDSGSIDLPEFRKVTEGLRKRMANASHLSHFKRTGFSSHQDEEGGSGIVRAFFGPAGKHSLDLDKFAHFLAALHGELVRLEFCHYAGSNEGMMSGRDFARSLVSGVQASMVDTYLDRIGKLPDSLAEKQLSLRQFQHFAELRKDMHSLTVALNFFHNTVGKLDKAAFTRAAKNITGAPLDPGTTDLVYAVFDLDGNDDLSPGEVIEVLRRREGNSAYKFEQVQRPSLFTCLVGCIAGDKMES